MSNFQQPAVANPEDKIVWGESLGALLLFFPSELKVAVPTQHGESDAVAAKVVRLEDGRVWENGLVFPMALVTQLKAAVPDGMVLGRLGQGENTKGNAPWLLQAHTAEDVAKAEAWLAANPRQQFAQPPVQVPPTAPAWGAQATPAAPAWGGPATAPAAQGWAQAAAHAPAPTAAWGAQPAATPAPAPSAGAVDPALVSALQAKGVTLPPGTNQASAESIWALVNK